MKKIVAVFLLVFSLSALAVNLVRGNLVTLWGVSVTLSPANIAANTSAEQTFTLNGLKTTDMVIALKPTAQAGLMYGGARASAADTVAITFGNLTASTITPTAAESWSFVIVRPEDTPLPSRFSP